MPADPRQAWCLTEQDRDGTVYICTQEAHGTGRHKMIKRDDMPVALRNALAAQTVAILEDADLVPVDTESAIDAALAKRLHWNARFEERKRHTARIDYEVQTADAFMADLQALDESRWAENLTADEASLRRIKARVDAWLLQVGIRADEEAGS